MSDPGATADPGAPGPVGRRFPEVVGSALSRQRVRLPDDLAGAPAVLLVAYERRTQQDIDRWSAFLASEAPETVVYELPTIPSLIWRPLAGWIDTGMRGGVPQELWSRVVTLYEDGGKVRSFLGDRRGGRAHCALLDETGVVRWFAARGFNDEDARQLLDMLARLEHRAAGDQPTGSPPADQQTKGGLPDGGEEVTNDRRAEDSPP